MTATTIDDFLLNFLQSTSPLPAVGDDYNDDDEDEDNDDDDNYDDYNDYLDDDDDSLVP